MSGGTTQLELDRSRCALCGEPNECLLARPEGDRGERCWCVDERFPAELTERPTQTDGGTRCICRRCLASHR